MGSSLADIDITRILHSSQDLRDRTYFIVGPTDDEILIFPLEDYGTIHRIGIEGLAEQIAVTTVPQDISSYQYSWLIPFERPSAPIEPDDKASIDLLTMGVIEPSHVAWSLGDPQPHAFVKRSEINEILAEISRGRRWFHSFRSW